MAGDTRAQAGVGYTILLIVPIIFLLADTLYMSPTLCCGG